MVPGIDVRRGHAAIPATALFTTSELPGRVDRAARPTRASSTRCSTGRVNRITGRPALDEATEPVRVPRQAPAGRQDERVLGSSCRTRGASRRR